jgi:hypothetical protein
MSGIGHRGSIEAFNRAPGLPVASIFPIIHWTWAFGLAPILLQETRAWSRTARLVLIWEIAVEEDAVKEKAGESTFSISRGVCKPNA